MLPGKGTIEQGKEADFILLEKKSLADNRIPGSIHER
jgi:hypothetical protein